MKHGKWLVLTALLVGSQTLQAQTVVQPDKTLSPAETLVSDALYVLRDSLTGVEASSSRFARDRAQASDAAMQSRSRAMATRCATAIPVTDAARKALADGGLPDPDPRAVRAGLDKSLVDLHTRLEWCTTEFTRLTKPENAQELRDYSIGRGEQVESATQMFVTRLQTYLFLGFGIRYRPNLRGAGATPSGEVRH